jgi:signal transduction histidine kinase/CheY-like chemotaxis protein/HPt (histidine-containing phosphotransfer) domain-containing protein
MNVLDYKQKYLSEQSHYQFILLDKDWKILDSCNSIWSFTSKLRKSLIEVFPFVESLQEAIWLQSKIFLPNVDLSLSKTEPAIYDFYFIVEEEKTQKHILCIIKDVRQTSKYILESQQKARLALLEKEYLELQNKNFQLENTLLQVKNKDLQKSKDLKNLFFSKISHELRSPVNGILGLSQIMLEDTNMQGETKNYIEGIYTAAKHLRTILDDILDISKLEAGNITLNRVVFQLKSIFQHIRLNFLHILETKKLYLLFEIDEKVPTFLVGDEIRLTQIFYNLVSNAIKFTESGGIRVSVNLEEQGKETCLLRFRVQDTGVGIPQERIEKIFEPYEQVGEFTYQELGGTGLGLSVVKQLIEIQKGSIRVESTVGKGTTFEFSLRLGYQEDISNDSWKLKKCYGLKALLVDDSDINRIYTKKLLTDLGFLVHSAEGGTEALEMLLKEYYDVLLTDIEMPDMNGYELVTQYSQLHKHSEETAIIFTTASIDAPEGYTVLLKPFNQEQLFQCIIKVLPSEKTQIYGLDYLLKITDHSLEFMQDMINSFLSSSPLDIQKLMDAITHRNVEAVHKAVHKLKPIATLMGNQVLSRVLWIMEKDCLGEHTHWASLEEQAQLGMRLMQISLDFFQTQKK